jgi:four helix bundle protein
MGKETGDRRLETGDRRLESTSGQPVLRRGADIAARLARFGIAKLHLGARLPRNAAGRHVSIQLIRSGTGAGSNYEEARAAESRADFIHKVCVAAKEMREACYWVALIGGSSWVEDELQSLIREAKELAAILGASARTARRRRDD